jgi:hypothetical protein
MGAGRIGRASRRGSVGLGDSPPMAYNKSVNPTARLRLAAGYLRR